eukprot:scaffold261787_cov28-Attheya_sp.AAC.1
MGPKNTCHQVVWRRLQHDLNQLNGSYTAERPNFYHSGLKRNIHVHSEIHCILQDSPERRSCNYVSAEDGKLNPSTITSKSLCAAVDKAHKYIVGDNIIGQSWKPKHAKAYLSVAAGWNGQGKDNIIQHAVHALKWKEAINKRIRA